MPSNTNEAIQNIEEEDRLKKGVLFSKWLKRVTRNPITKQNAKPREVAEAAKISYGRANIFLYHDCKESDGRIFLPRPETIDAIAEAYHVDPDEAKALVGYIPNKSVENLYIPDPGMTKHALPDGNTLFIRADEPDPERLVQLYISFMIGVETGIARARTAAQGEAAPPETGE